MKKIQSVRGMKDVLPSDCKIYSGLENLLSSSASQFGYREIRTPILEDSELFIKTIGDGTDIVEKEMYTFVDSKKNSYSMRPEGTASCARAIIQGGLTNTINKVWYCGPFFRHERPQKGRYRQFHQFGAEYIGVEGFEADVEIVLLADFIWKKLKIKPRLKVNTIGNHEERKKYIAKLQDYFSRYQDILSEDEKIKMEKNPLRILDSKNQNIIDLLKQCPKINEFVSKDSRNHFEKFLKGLDKNKICFEKDDNLVRGLDYYNSSVVALNADTGEVVWHFKTVYHDVWDYDVPSQPTFYNIEKDGKIIIFSSNKISLCFNNSFDSSVASFIFKFIFQLPATIIIYIHFCQFIYFNNFCFEVQPSEY